MNFIKQFFQTLDMSLQQDRDKLLFTEHELLCIAVLAFFVGFVAGLIL